MISLTEIPLINISSWIEDYKKYSSKITLLVLIGNKSDLNYRRKVSFEEGRDLAKKNNMIFFEYSSKNGSNVNEVFLFSLKKISEKIEQ